MSQSSDNSKSLGAVTLVGLVVMIVAVVVLQFLLRTSGGTANRIQHTDFGALMNSALASTTTLNTVLQSNLPDEAVVASSIQFTGRNSQTVQSWLSKPAGHDAAVAVILIPDNTTGTDTAAHLAQTVGASLSSAASVVTLTVQLPPDAKLSDQLSNIVSAVDYLRATADVTDGSIILMGTGLGAYQAIQVSATVPVDGIISIGGFAEPGSVYEQLQTNHADSATQFLRIMGCEMAPLPDGCLQQLSVIDAIQPALPTLIMQTTTDPLTPDSQATALGQQILPALVTTVTIPTTAEVHDVFASSTTDGYLIGWNSLLAWLNQQSVTAVQRRTP